ncbi:MAG: hypothetical protein ACYCYE_14105 [Clostridia bacterium]
MTDSVDYSTVRWVSGKYEDRDLENLFVFEQAIAERRIGYIVSAIDRYCTDRLDIIGIGFCATKKHAEFMANIFKRVGASLSTYQLI